MKELHFDRSNGCVDELIDQLLLKTGPNHPTVIREMILCALKAGMENDYLADLRIINNAMKEMRFSNKIFAPHRDTKKVSIFGSARTPQDDVCYQMCHEFAGKLVENGYMTITGGGPGIMEAGNEGAGRGNTFALNIKLPFEQHANASVQGTDMAIDYKYFFTRKLAFLREADAVALFPGGFGTLDEAMETLTLIQTGKNPIVPVVCIDDDREYWKPWIDFTSNILLERGLISEEDFSLFSLTKSVDEAVDIINNFYRVYHSSRFVNSSLVIRLKKLITREQVEQLNDNFSSMMEADTRIQQTIALPEENDQPNLVHLPRLVCQFNRRNYGTMKEMIRMINTF